MRRRILCLFFCLSVIIWVLSFLLRVHFMDELPEYVGFHPDTTLAVLIPEDIVGLVFEDSNWRVFVLIWKNNIVSCLINILGGTILGTGTIGNIAMNGFYSADMVIMGLRSGIDKGTALRLILPHSFELVGFWISGAVGFSWAWYLIRIMMGKATDSYLFYRQTGVSCLIVFVTITIAAFVESYFSIPPLAGLST